MSSQFNSKKIIIIILLKVALYSRHVPGVTINRNRVSDIPLLSLGYLVHFIRTIWH